MSTVKSCIAQKSGLVFSLPSTASVQQALQLMKDRRVRAVLVIDDDVLSGIVSQGDCAIRVLLAGRDPHKTSLADIMTGNPLTVGMAMNLDQCMKIMMERSISHLPVVEASKVVGMISIGDIVKDIIQQQGMHIKYLETYIKGHAVEY